MRLSILPDWRLPTAASIVFAIVSLTAAAQAGNAIKARLSSSNAAEDVTGTLTLDGYSLTGRLSGGNIDVTVTGVVKSKSVNVEITGRIVPDCGLNRQSMNGVGENRDLGTAVEMTFECPTKAWGGGVDYLFRLDLGLPALHINAPGTDPGEDAANRTSREIYGDPA